MHLFYFALHLILFCLDNLRLLECFWFFMCRWFRFERNSDREAVLFNDSGDGVVFGDHFLMVTSALERIPDLDVLGHQHINLHFLFVLKRQVKQFFVSPQEINVSPLLYWPPVRVSLLLCWNLLSPDLDFFSRFDDCRFTGWGWEVGLSFVLKRCCFKCGVRHQVFFDLVFYLIYVLL